MYRETVQQAFEVLNRVETLYVNEAIVFYKAIRDTNIDRIKESEFGKHASECSDKVIALLELYFPFMEEFIDEFCEIEAELVNYHNEVIDPFNEVDLESYNKESERLSDVMAEKNISNEILTVRYDAKKDKLLTRAIIRQTNR